MLDEGGRRGGWVPADDLEDPDDRHDGGDFGDGDFDDEPPPPSRTAGAGLPHGIGRHRSPGRAVRWDPGQRGARSLWLAGLLAALVVIGWTWLDRPRIDAVPSVGTGSAQTGSAESSGSGEPPAAPSVGEAAVTSATVVVSVVGLVTRPGLVTLASGSRVADAVAAAGGLRPEADPASLNLAAVVSDGQQIAVGVPGSSTAAGTAGGRGSAGRPGSGTAGKVDLNTATAGELDELPGIGPVLAQRIVAHRTAEGPFTSVDQLDDVPGIGPTIAEELAELVTV